MKKYRNIIFLFILALGGLSLLFAGCEEEDNYNYDNITPKLIGGISGPKVATASGSSAYNYSVLHRGGSTYQWNVTGNDATIEQDSEVPSRATITWAQSSVDAQAVLTVTETTLGGKTASASDTVDLMAFCPYPVEDYAGDWTGTTADHADPVVIEAGENPNQVIVHGLAEFVNTAWGESWTEGDGSCVMEFKCGDVVTISNQWIGDTDYPDVYYIEGTGSVDPEAMTITLDYEVFYAGGDASAAEISTTLTLGGAKKQAQQSFVKNKR